jgi:hypothetical protein
VRALIRVAAVAVLLSAVGPAMFIRGFLRSVALGPGESLPARVAVLYVVGPALLAGLGVVSGLLLLGCRRSGRLGALVFLVLVSGWVIAASTPGDADRYLPLWFSLPPLGFLVIPAVGRACG